METHHEITWHKVEQAGKAFLGRVVGRPLHLVCVEVETSDVRAGELDNLSGRSADAAADVKDLHARLDACLVRNVVFVSGDGLSEPLAVGESAEVERLTPSIFVKVGREVIISNILNISFHEVYRVGT